MDQPLQVARAVDQLATKEGPNLFLKTLKAFQPRVQQEARHLYQVGAQNDGMLSRQNGEPVISYALRRKTWHDTMVGFNAGLKLPGAILAEQLFGNAAQHSRIHEKEQRGKSYGKYSMYSKAAASTNMGLGGFTMLKTISVKLGRTHLRGWAAMGYGEYDFSNAYYTAEDSVGHGGYGDEPGSNEDVYSCLRHICYHGGGRPG